MNEYHKIDTVFKRDPATRHKSLIIGDFANEAFAYLRNNTWVFTEKVDGTNIRVLFKDGRVSFGGKTDAASIPTKLVDNLRQQFDNERKLALFAEKFPDGVCLYGEGYGAKIQNGGNYRDDQGFVLFDVRVGKWWLRRENVEQVANEMTIDIVPVIGRGTLDDMVSIVQDGFPSRWGNFVAEGIVARPEVELTTRHGQRIITKLKHKDFGALR